MSPTKLAKSLGISSGTVTGWKKGHHLHHARPPQVLCQSLFLPWHPVKADSSLGRMEKRNRPQQNLYQAFRQHGNREPENRVSILQKQKKPGRESSRRELKNQFHWHFFIGIFKITNCFYAPQTGHIVHKMHCRNVQNSQAKQGKKPHFRWLLPFLIAYGGQGGIRTLVVFSIPPYFTDYFRPH